MSSRDSDDNRAWDALPARFSYLQEVARRYGSEPVSAGPNGTSVDGYGPGDLQALAETYRQIRSRGQATAISAWVDSLSREGPQGTYLQIARPVFNLFGIFELLARKGIEPFATRDVLYQPAVEKPNWKHLPQPISYLAEPAQRYGRYSYESQMTDFLENASTKEMAELRGVAERVRNQDDFTRYVEPWLDRYLEAQAPGSRNVERVISPDGLGWSHIHGRRSS